MAEKLAIEQAMMQLKVILQNQRLVPVGIGIFFAYIFFAASSPKSIADSNGFSQVVEGVAALVGFGLGFGVGCLRNSIVRTKILQRVKKQEIVMLQRLGVARRISWDADVIISSSPMLKNQIKWHIFDELVNGKVGIYGRVGDQYLFRFPKAALPQNLTAEELLQTWQSYRSKPPKLA
ncbi:MAG: hypothetical protein RL616_2715 [Verrucomicrobiota bacterium]